MYKPPDNTVTEQLTCCRKTIEITVRTRLRTYWNVIHDIRWAEEDIVNSVYEKIIKLLKKYPGRKLNSAYIQKVVNSCIADYYRMEKKHVLNRVGYEYDISGYRHNYENDGKPAMNEYGREDAGIEEISEHSAFINYVGILYEAIDKLSERDRVIFVFSRFYGKSAKELSELTGLTESNIKVRLTRIRYKLAREVLGSDFRPSKRTGKHFCI